MLESLNTGVFEYEKLKPEEMKARGILGRLVGVMADTVNPTRNGRSYSEQLWENVFNNPIMQERIENKCCFGELGHPLDREETDMEKIAICMDSVPKKDSDGKLQAVFNILDTPNGRILKTLCDYGCNIGISSRGSGDLVQDFDGNESVDPDTYNCEGWDAVLIPAVKEARLKYVNESLEKTRYNKSLRTRLQEAVEKEDVDKKKAMTESLNTFLGESIWDEIESDTIEEPAAGPEPNADFVDELDQNIEGGEPQMDEAPSGDMDLPPLNEPSDDGDLGTLDTGDEGGDDIDSQLDDIFSSPEFSEPTPENIEYNGVEIIQDPDTGKYVCEIDQDTYVFNSEKNAKIWIDMNQDLVAKDKVDDKFNKYEFEDEPKESEDVTIEKEPEEAPEEAPEDFPVPDLKMEESLNEQQVGRDTYKDDKDVDDVMEPEDESEDSEEEDDEDKVVIKFKEEIETTPETSINEEAGNTRSDVDSFYEMLENNLVLEKRVIELQEKLSVSHAEESRLNEEISSLREKIAKLSQVAKENKALKEQVKTIKDSSTKLNESLNKNSTVVQSLKEQLKTAKQEKNSVSTELETLQEDYSKLEKDSTQLNEQLNKKIDNQNKLLEKYQKITKNAVDRYINLQATNLGVKSTEIRNRLPEQFSFADVDSICEELREYKLNVSRLPFNTSKPLKESNVRVNNLREGLVPRNEMDELTDYDLKMMELFK